MATQFLFKLCHPRTNSTPASERDKKNKQTYKRHIFAPTAGVRSISPKLCMVVELGFMHKSFTSSSATSFHVFLAYIFAKCSQ